MAPTASPFSLSMILIDIEMPIQDGLTCTRNIRELERAGKIVGGRVPIIAVSANARMEQILEAKEAGCDDVLVKPYRMPELLERMKTVMSRVVGGTGETAAERACLEISAKVDRAVAEEGGKGRDVGK